MTKWLHKMADWRATGGAVDRMMAPAVNSAVTNILPQEWQQPVLNHYNQNQSLYNAGLLGLGGVALYNGVSSIFGNRGNSSGGGDSGGDMGSWLWPMLLIGGGTYLYNKYGDQIASGIKNFGELSKLSKSDINGLKTSAAIGKGINRVGQFLSRIPRPWKWNDPWD